MNENTEKNSIKKYASVDILKKKKKEYEKFKKCFVNNKIKKNMCLFKISRISILNKK